MTHVSPQTSSGKGQRLHLCVHVYKYVRRSDHNICFLRCYVHVLGGSIYTLLIVHLLIISTRHKSCVLLHVAFGGIQDRLRHQ